MALLEIGECEEFKGGKKMVVVTSLEKKEHKGDQLEICLSGLGPEEQVLKMQTTSAFGELFKKLVQGELIITDAL